MQLTLATVALMVAAASASADPIGRARGGRFWACGVPGSACGKRDIMDLVEARNAAEVKRAEDYFTMVEKREADPIGRARGGRFWACGVPGSACGKRDLEYLGILERNAEPIGRARGGRFWACGVPGSACGKRDVMEKIEARNEKRTANAEAIIARNAEADPIGRARGGRFWACGVPGSACGKRDLEELEILDPEHEE